MKEAPDVPSLTSQDQGPIQNIETKNWKLESQSVVEVSKIQNEKECEKLVGLAQYSGLALAVLASLFLSLVSVLVKVLRDYHPFSLAVWRQWGNVIPAVFMVLYFRYWQKQEIFEQIWPLGKNDNTSNVIGLAIRGFLSASIVILRFWALDYLTVADCTVVTYCSPIFILVLAHIFLKEKFAITSCIIGLWTLIGVVVIARPPFLTGKEIDIDILIGTGITILSVICQCSVVILVCKSRTIHFSIMMLAFGVWGVGQSYLVALPLGVFAIPQSVMDITLTALLAIFAFLAQMCVILSLRFEQAGPVSLIRTSDVIFAFIWQIVLLHVIPDLFSILGAGIVMIGVLVTALRKWVSTLPEENLKRRAL